MQLVGLAEEGVFLNSGLSEFKRIYSTLLNRRRNTPQRLVSPMLANENKRLLYLDRHDRPCVAAITALSPSDGRVKMAISAFANAIPKEGDPQRSISVNQNDTSVALWVQFGNQHVLLGADLEHTGIQGEGWMAVLESFQGSSRAQLYKIPHHGSANGHHQEIWDRLLQPNPVAALTPYSSGLTPLPQPSELAKLRQLTNELYCTSTGGGKVAPKDPLVEKLARNAGVRRRALEGKPGHIRVRWSVADPTPKVEVFNGAFKVN